MLKYYERHKKTGGTAMWAINLRKVAWIPKHFHLHNIIVIKKAENNLFLSTDERY